MLGRLKQTVTLNVPVFVTMSANEEYDCVFWDSYAFAQNDSSIAVIQIVTKEPN